MMLLRTYHKALSACGLLLAGMVFAGCSHLYYADPNPPSPYVFPGQSPSPGLATPNPVSPSGPPVAVATPTGNPSLPTPTTGGGSHTVSDILAIGDSVTVSFSDIPPPGLLPVIQRIGNDGKITLPYNVKVTAAGKTVGQLQDDIRKEYVPAIFVFMTCSVKSEERVFYVDGEVKLAGRLPYLGEMTVLRAISSAQGFTDFAQRHKIEVRRATGQKVMIDWYKAMKNTSLDVPVYPNDHIIVRRRVW